MALLLIDDRENPKVINKLFMSIGDRDLDDAGQAQKIRLESGDYVIGSLGIEAKEINDLYNSIVGLGRTRTINDQLDDMLNSYTDAMLVVYGTQLKPFIRGKSNRQMYAKQVARMQRVILNYKMDLHRRYPNLKFMQFDTMDEFVAFLVRTATQEKMSSVASSRLPRVSKDARIQALSSLPGVSVRIAEDLMKEFGSLPQMMKARVTQKDLMKIKGIGRQKARMLLTLRESY